MACTSEGTPIKMAERAVSGTAAGQSSSLPIAQIAVTLSRAAYVHLYRVTIGDGNALAVEVNLVRHLQHSATTRPSTNAHHVRLTSPSNTAISVWPLADPLLDWEVLT
jgi:hypothetical protein